MILIPIAFTQKSKSLSCHRKSDFSKITIHTDPSDYLGFNYSSSCEE